MLLATILATVLGTATTPEPIDGLATWFDATRNGQSASYTRAGIDYYIAAGPELRRAMGGRFYQQVRPVRICNHGTGRCLTAYVTDWCACRGTRAKGDERIADLSPKLFAALGIPLSRGAQRVTITPLVSPTRGVVDSSDSGRCAAPVWGITNAPSRRCAHRHRTTRRGYGRVC
jgi:hypothetical protein